MSLHDCISFQKKFISSYILSYYPLKEKQLNSLNIEISWLLVIMNRNIVWTSKMVQHFLPEITATVKGVKEWDDECLESCENPTFPWSIDLIDLFKDELDWSYMAQNSIFTSCSTLVEHYWIYLSEHQGVIKVSPVDPKSNGIGEENFGWFDVTRPDFIFKEQCKHIFSDSITWTMENISKHQEHIDWFWLSRYRRISWDINLINAFSDKWDVEGVLSNTAVHLTLDILKALGITEDLPLGPHKERIWQEIFAPHLDDTQVDKIILNYLS